MTTPQQRRKTGGPFPPPQTEVLGLSLQPVQPETSPPSAGSRIGSQIRIPQMQGVPIPQPQSQSQSSHPQQPKFYAAPPSPSHTAHSQSPPTTTISPSGFSNHSNMSNQGQTGSFPRQPMRVPPPMPESWTNESDTLVDTLDDRMVDHRPRPGSGSLIEPQRTSPIPTNNASRSVAANRTRPRPNAASSSPVQTASMIRQLPYAQMPPPQQLPQQTQFQPQQQPQQSQFSPQQQPQQNQFSPQQQPQQNQFSQQQPPQQNQFPSQPPQQNQFPSQPPQQNQFSSQQPQQNQFPPPQPAQQNPFLPQPSQQNQYPPQLSRMPSQTAHGIPTIPSAQSLINRPPPHDASARALLTPPNSLHKGLGDHHEDDEPPRHSVSPHYHTPFDHQELGDSVGNQPSPTSTNEYSHPFQYDADTQTEYTTEHEVDVSDAEPRVATIHEHQVQKATLQPNVPVTNRAPNRLPFQEVEEVDDVTPSGTLLHQQEPLRWNPPMQQHPMQQHPQQQQQQQQQQQLQQPRSQKKSTASPPPASPSPHPPIPILSPQSVSVAHPPLLGQRPPSPPAAPPAQSTLLVNNNQGQVHDHDEPAEASSDNFTPKSPNAPLPIQDHDYNYGRYARNHPADNFNHHYSFAAQMGAMVPPRGPVHLPQTFTSLSGAAASLTGDAHNGVPNGNTYDPWDEYVDFYNHQRSHNHRPSAPVPPTPQSAIPSQTPAFNAAHGMPFEQPLIPERYIPSALSSYLSSPMMHNPFLQRLPPPQSIVSSPSHQPLELLPGPMNVRRNGRRQTATKKKPKSKLSSPPIAPPPMQPLPPRVESTVPKDTSSETDSDTGDDSGRTQRRPKEKHEEDSDDDEDTEEEDVWLSESSEDELDTEFHSRYILNPSKRKRKWDQKWEAMIRLFQELDRTTDSPMILLASPSTSSTPPKTHILLSRAITRDPGKYMPHAQTCRIAFSKISKARRRERLEQATLDRARKAQSFEQQLAQLSVVNNRLDDLASGSSGSPRTGVTPQFPNLAELPQLAAKGEDGLKTALGMALESMRQMQVIYEQREERRREEAERQRQETVGLDFFLRLMNQQTPSRETGQPISDKSNGGSPQNVPLKSKSP